MTHSNSAMPLVKTFVEASNPNARGDGSNLNGAVLVFVDERNFPGAYRVTGTYSEANGVVTIEEIIIKKTAKPSLPYQMSPVIILMKSRLNCYR